MTKIVCNDGTEEYLSPGAARAKVTAGEASYPKEQSNMYSTRQMVADKPKEEVKTKRKRRSKAEMEADEAAAQAASDETE
jgi:hypothetical protein